MVSIINMLSWMKKIKITGNTIQAQLYVNYGMV